ncbi:hypothetical protein M422DRAFT_259355 [Sphaerobolus stellatus SS14]|uniref:Uncharacterized protein n=1 Tax=Sphaerobolus stellatus (strain SS14) TaxID=990650 RepID=A0A0C9V8W3_SPHS4|nr:hypothetical protein M422DRAFT_259355 [Sphaerobolus stellatus SS14]
MFTVFSEQVFQVLGGWRREAKLQRLEAKLWSLEAGGWRLEARGWRPRLEAGG